MSTTCKNLYFEKGKKYDKKKIEFCPVELFKYLKKTTKEKVTGKGKNKKIEMIEDEDNLECVKNCLLTFTLKTKDE